MVSNAARRKPTAARRASYSSRERSWPGPAASMLMSSSAPKPGSASSPSNHFDNRDAAIHRLRAYLEDPDGPLVVPVVKDELQEVEVGRGTDSRKTPPASTSATTRGGPPTTAPPQHIPLIRHLPTTM